MSEVDGLKKQVEDLENEIAKLLKQTDDINFQIRKLEYENCELTMENDRKIEEHEKLLIETEAQLKEALTKTKEDAVKVKCGWTHFRTLKDMIVIKDESKTIEEIKIKLPSFVDDLIQYVETYSIRKDKLNQLVKDQTIRIEVLETVTVETQEKKFEYKYTGGK